MYVGIINTYIENDCELYKSQFNLNACVQIEL